MQKGGRLFSSSKVSLSGPRFDPEIERPIGYTEYVSGDESWKKVGIRIKWTQPRTPGPGTFRASVDVPLRIRLCVESKVEMDVPPDNLTAWCWTPIVTEDNPCGIWKEIELQYNPRCTQWDDCGIRTYIFVGRIRALRQDVYRVTFNIKWNNIMVWSNQYQDDNMADIEINPSKGTQTTRYPMVHFTSNFAEGQTDKCVASSDIDRPARLTPKDNDDRVEDLEMLIMY